MSGSLPRLLRVDDEPRRVFLITRALEKLGIAAEGLTSADNALAAFTREPRSFTARRRRDSSGCIDPAEALRAAAVGGRTVIRKRPR